MFPKQCYLTNARRFYYQLSEVYNPGYKLQLVKATRKTSIYGGNTKALKWRQEREYFQSRYDYEAKDELPSCASTIYTLKKKSEGHYYLEQTQQHSSDAVSSHSKQTAVSNKTVSPPMKYEISKHVFFDNSLMRECVEQTNNVKETIQQSKRASVAEEAARRYLGVPTFANSNAFTQIPTMSKETKYDRTMPSEPFQGSIEADKFRFPGYRPTKKTELPKSATILADFDGPHDIEEFKEPARRAVSQVSARKYLGLPTFINHSEYTSSTTYKHHVPQRSYVLSQGYNGTPGYFDAKLYKRTQVAKLEFSTDARSMQVMQSQEGDRDVTFHFVSRSETWLPNVLFSSTLIRKMIELPNGEKMLENVGEPSNVHGKPMMLSKFKKLLRKSHYIFKKSNLASTA